MRMGLPGEVETQLAEGRQGDGSPLPTAWRARLKREWQQVQGLTEQSGSLEAERRAGWRTSEEPGMATVRQLATRRGMGVQSAGRLVREFFAWRGFQTPKQGGA